MCALVRTVEKTSSLLYFIVNLLGQELLYETVISRAVARMDEKLLLAPSPVTRRYAKCQETNSQNSLDPHAVLKPVVLK